MNTLYYRMIRIKPEKGFTKTWIKFFIFKGHQKLNLIYSQTPIYGTPICGRTPYCGTNACWPNFLLNKISPKTPFFGTQNPDLRDFFLQIQKNLSIFSTKFAFHLKKYEVASTFWAWWDKINSYFSQTSIKDGIVKGRIN